MNHRRTLLQLALPLLLTAFAASAKAETLQYQERDLSGRVKVTIPSHWFIRDLAGRQNIAAAANAVLDPTGKQSEPTHYSSLSALSTRESPQVIFRISFVQTPGSQADLERSLRHSRSATIREISEAHKQGLDQMDESLRRLGTPYLGEERFDVVDIGGKKAMLISYKRADLGGGSPFRGNQYHVPMGSDKILITASIQDSAAPLMGPIVERILASLVIHR